MITLTPWVDPVHATEVHLAVGTKFGDPVVGVAHAGCTEVADLVLDLDAFYCASCMLSGRISGAWALERIREVFPYFDVGPPRTESPLGAQP